MKKKIDERIIKLLQLHLMGDISPEEAKELEAWCEEREANRRFFERVCREDLFAREHGLYVRVDERGALTHFKRRIGLPRRRERSLRWWRVAAVIALPLAVAAVWLYWERSEEPVVVAERIVPGSAKAVLVLDDGRKVALTPEREETIQVAEQAEAQSSGDKLTYEAEEKNEREVRYNTLEIPRGGEFKLELADGTTVHLNSATRLKYPVAFAGKERRVALDGEAYFDVAKDAEMPFVVSVEGMDVTVYGTSFNVNSQREGRVQTVLVSGSVGVKAARGGEETRIVPGEMAEFDTHTGRVAVTAVDTAMYTDWRNGILRFSNERLERILEMLERWYDVDFFYQNQDVKELHFTGYMERYKDIGVILESMTLATGVRFSIQGRTIVVSR